jgi:branched-chain amino acid transport system permease protein
MSSTEALRPDDLGPSDNTDETDEAQDRRSLTAWARDTYGSFATPVALVGAVVILLGGFLAWTYSVSYADNLTINFSPIGGQRWVIGGAVLLIVFLLTDSVLARPLRGVLPEGGVRASIAMAVALLGLGVVVAIRASYVLGGLANVNTGLWLVIVGGVVATLGALGRSSDRPPAGRFKPLPTWLDFVIIGVSIGIGLVLMVKALDSADEVTFLAILAVVGGGVAGLQMGGLMPRIAIITGSHYGVTVAAAFIAAIVFPFTQGTNSAYLSIAVNVAIFAAAAIGLNIVVGLAGLLDLGYIAFTGVGAALFSGSAASIIASHHQPFLAVFVGGGIVAAIFGLIIGAPTLRLRGDYLAIVTLGFGEIFRITVNNLNGSSGPNLTNGPQGIYAIPDLNLFGINFGKDQTIFGTQMSYFANYYFLALVLIAFVIFIFVRANGSRIGRAWVAIREDETAASAMGVNTFKLKLLAFAMGAFLAGLAGTIQAHSLSSVTPDSYVFLNSSFLLSAVVLGGMGTVLGPLLGALLLLVIPEKLRFFQDWRLWLFGLALILMMRFRPEGLIASRRRALEFHEAEEDDAAAPLSGGLGAPPGATAGGVL